MWITCHATLMLMLLPLWTITWISFDARAVMVLLISDARAVVL